MTFDYAIHEISYANVLMYCATLPSYDFERDKNGKKKAPAVRADDPENREEVLAIINGKKF